MLTLTRRVCAREKGGEQKMPQEPDKQESI